MPVIGSGVYELRVRDTSGTVRVFYAIGKGDAILVFHAFETKSRRTPRREIDLARQRPREVLDAREEF